MGGGGEFLYLYILRRMGTGESDAGRRIKTEFLVQMEGVGEVVCEACEACAAHAQRGSQRNDESIMQLALHKRSGTPPALYAAAVHRTAY